MELRKERAVLKTKNAPQQGHIEISKTTTDEHPPHTHTHTHVPTVKFNFMYFRVVQSNVSFCCHILTARCVVDLRPTLASRDCIWSMTRHRMPSNRLRSMPNEWQRNVVPYGWACVGLHAVVVDIAVDVRRMKLAKQGTQCQRSKWNAFMCGDVAFYALCCIVTIGSVCVRKQ